MKAFGTLARSRPRGASAGDGVLGFGEVVQHPHAALVEGLPLGGEREAPGGAVQEPHLQVLLQLRHGVGGRRRGELQVVGCPDKGAVLDHPGEDPHAKELVHGRNY